MHLPSTDLLTDVFSFLCFLHADDVHPSHSRFLPLAALEKINASFLLPDDLRIPSPRRVRGKRGLTERETERIRFVHFLCEAADLVALTGRFLKPTPRAAHWLTRSTFERAAELFAALCNDARRVQDLWRIYRLPASHATLVMLLDLLRAIPRADPVHLTTLHKLIPLPMLDDRRDAPPETVWRELLRYLEWFGVIQNDESAAPTLQLTAWGACLLRRTDAPTLSTDPPPQPLKLRELTFHIPPYAHLSTLYELADYATPLPRQRRGRGWDDRRACAKSLDIGV